MLQTFYWAFLWKRPSREHISRDSAIQPGKCCSMPQETWRQWLGSFWLHGPTCSRNTNESFRVAKLSGCPGRRWRNDGSGSPDGRVPARPYALKATDIFILNLSMFWWDFVYRCFVKCAKYFPETPRAAATGRRCQTEVCSPRWWPLNHAERIQCFHYEIDGCGLVLEQLLKLPRLEASKRC